MRQKLTTSSASGNTSHQRFSKSTGRTGHFTATSPTLLPTPNALDYINPRSLEALRRAKQKGGCRNMKDLVSHPQEYGVELGATETKRSLYSQEASHASHSVTQDEEKVRQMTAISGRTCFELYKTSSQTGSSLKMCVGLLLGTTAWYSSRCALTWKAKATKSNRLLFQLSPSMLRTAETESGLLPTVQTQGLKVCIGREQRPSKDIQSESKKPERQNGHYSGWDRDWREVATATCNARMDDGISREVDGISYSFAKWRNESIKAYGNAIVPQVAMEIFRAIKGTTMNNQPTINENNRGENDGKE